MNVTRTVLPNGVRLLLAPQHETKAMTLLFLVGTGSRFERAEQNGISHFLEHILFKGTDKYPQPEELAAALDGVGADFNAYTSEEYTGYYIHAAAEHFPLALEILHEMFYHPRYAIEDIEREKGVIVEEINMYHDLPQRHVFDELKSLMYGDTPMGRNIAGTPDRVRSFDKSTFVNYQSAWYTPDNIIVSVAGNPQDFDWESMLSERFSEKSGAKAGTYEPIVVSYDAPRVKIDHRPTDQTHLALALPTIAESDDLLPVQTVLSTILGGTMSSRLFSEIREKRGLAYYVRSGADAYHDTGSLIVSTGVRNAQAKEAISVILDQLDRLRREPIADAELRKAKEHFRGKMALQLEGSTEMASINAQQELYYGRQFTAEQLVAQVAAVTTADVQQFASRYFTREQLSLSAVGPFDPSDFLPILEKAFPNQ